MKKNLPNVKKENPLLFYGLPFCHKNSCGCGENGLNYCSTLTGNVLIMKDLWHIPKYSVKSAIAFFTCQHHTSNANTADILSLSAFLWPHCC